LFRFQEHGAQEFQGVYHLDILVACTLLIVGPGFVPRGRKHWPIGLRLLLVGTSLVLMTLLTPYLFGSPLSPHFQHGDNPVIIQLWERLIEAGWWTLLARFAALLIRLIVIVEDRPRETKIVSDLLTGTVTLTTVLCIVNFAFDVPIRGLLATSGIIAIVLGLALQNTLADLFSGIAIGLEHVYKVGDTIWIEGGLEGRVLQITWRSTQLRTDAADFAIVPNSIIAKARIINRNAPTPMRQATIPLSLSSLANIEHCLAVLNAALIASPRILRDPPPTVLCDGLKGDGLGFQVSFCVASSDLLAATRTEVLNKIHLHLTYAGIALSVPGVAGSKPPAVTPIDLLANSDLFGLLSTSQHEHLAQLMTAVEFDRGTTLISQAATTERLYLIAEGVLELSILDNAIGQKRVVHLSGPGESLGAVGLLTGDIYRASALALTKIRAFQLCRTDLLTVMTEEPALGRALKDMAARILAMIEADSGTTSRAPVGQIDAMSSRLRRLLRALGA
jgi:small-conductance mechanosensitive channel/CRP-like cAMP-binding protein